MQLRFTREWGNKPLGFVLQNPHSDLAANLLRNGVVEVVNAAPEPKAQASDKPAPGSNRRRR